MSAVTPNAAVLLVARTLIGLAIGADSAIATAYTAEYARAIGATVTQIFEKDAQGPGPAGAPTIRRAATA